MIITNFEGVAPKKRVSMRCPYIEVKNFMGTTTVSALQDYVVARKSDFTPAKVRRRQRGNIIDVSVRNCWRLKSLGPFEPILHEKLSPLISEFSKELGVLERAGGPAEFEICSYTDGGLFVPHIDTFDTLGEERILSCVYYFASVPRRFSGGLLRLHGFPTPGAKSEHSVQIVDITPETDSLIVFPSWLAHEVLPVQVATGDWADGRFTINCWVHRVPAQ
jgi:SM-20-related protein